MKRYQDNVTCWLTVLAVLLLALLTALAGCEEYPLTPAPAAEEETAEVVETSVQVRTADRATLAVYDYLLAKAESYQAKTYLAEFYTVCDNWSALPEYYKDGSGVWYVTVDMTAVEPWLLREHWQRASWLVFRDGKVLPSPELGANALRIEADLQELSGTGESPP